MVQFWRKLIPFLMTAMAASAVIAQTKAKPVIKKPVAQPVVVQPQPTPSPTPAKSQKRNERPVEVDQTPKIPPFTPVYFYEFSRPGFLTEKVTIEHDESGKGKVTFKRLDSDEMITDPIELSPRTMEMLKESFANLNFLDSIESYQYEKDYPHMGNVAITVKKDGKSRTAKYNWTVNKDAKQLMDIYRGIGQEYVWRFEIGLASEMQPLQTPSLMDAITLYVDRNEIADPPHLIPILTKLSTDERMPLMARNRASKLIKEIEKAAAKKD